MRHVHTRRLLEAAHGIHAMIKGCVLKHCPYHDLMQVAELRICCPLPPGWEEYTNMHGEKAWRWVLPGPSLPPNISTCR